MTAIPPRSAPRDPSGAEESSAMAAAIIPVRGGSVGIPRKNARLLLGVPLLAYAIEAAQRSALVDAVFVSTDDPELAELARRFGAEVIERPAALAGPAVTLDAVVLDAVVQLEASGRHFDDVVTIQATSPLVRPATIDRVLRQRRERGDDTVLTVVNAPHLAWGEDGSGALVPLYAARRNRQELPPHYRETGGVVACRYDVLAHGTRFGERVSAVEVEKAEALDIDDHFDWWLVEKSLRRRRTCFRVVGNRETGLGHAYRALTLADRLIDHDVRFVVREEHALAAELIRARFHRVQVVPAGGELDALRDAEPDLVVSDVLDTEKSEMEALRELGAALVNFEDLGPGAALADHVVNALYDAPASALAPNAYHGSTYCVLRDEFYSVAPIAVHAEVRELLLLFGGTDPGDLTARCLGWLESLPGDWRVTAVLGPGYPNRERLEALATRSRRPVEIVSDTRIVSRYMARADVAITSAGRTVFELASLGVPMLVIPQNDRECRHSFANQSRGVIALPRASELDELEFLGAAHDLLSREELRRHLHRSLLAADLRSGVDRALDVLARALGAQEER
jgi:CMP-N-acetylneuraminic acid synthetase/spore coat polysaccharide biosynthesis predicted glycosyltransferase SpsG